MFSSFTQVFIGLETGFSGSEQVLGDFFLAALVLSVFKWGFRWIFTGFDVLDFNWF